MEDTVEVAVLDPEEVCRAVNNHWWQICIFLSLHHYGHKVVNLIRVHIAHVVSTYEHLRDGNKVESTRLSLNRVSQFCSATTASLTLHEWNPYKRMFYINTTNKRSFKNLEVLSVNRENLLFFLEMFWPQSSCEMDSLRPQKQ